MSQRVRRVVAGTVSVMALSTFLTPPLLAQDPTINSRRTSPVTRDMRYREWILKDLEKKGSKSAAQLRLDWAQIGEDFRRMQILNNEVTNHKASHEVLDLRLIEGAVAEIHDRSVRLQSKLALPAGEGNGERGAGLPKDLQMRTMLSALSGLIRTFVKNPIFGETEVLDAREGIKARDALERIIRVSKEVRERIRDDR